MRVDFGIFKSSQIKTSRIYLCCDLWIYVKYFKYWGYFTFLFCLLSYRFSFYFIKSKFFKCLTWGWLRRFESIWVEYQVEFLSHKEHTQDNFRCYARTVPNLFPAVSIRVIKAHLCFVLLNKRSMFNEFLYLNQAGHLRLQPGWWGVP